MFCSLRCSHETSKRKQDRDKRKKGSKDQCDGGGGWIENLDEVKSASDWIKQMRSIVHDKKQYG